MTTTRTEREHILSPISARVVLYSLLSAMCLCGLVVMGTWTEHALAADAAPAATAPGTRFATVMRIRGEVTATPAVGGTPRVLREGDLLHVGEQILAASTAEAVLKTDDAGWIALRPGVRFVMERYAAEGKPADTLSVRLITGGLRMITGWIGLSDRAQYRVSSQTATMGIRGTDHEPYVVTADLAITLAQPAGTYDKVNRGGTTLRVDDKTLDIDAGRVGFVRERVKSRALLTLLLPVLLDKVPGFYVPGQFDAELDKLSQTAEGAARRALNARGVTTIDGAASPGATSSTLPAAKPAAKPAATGRATATTRAPSSSDAACAATAIAKTWLSELDNAITRGDASAITAKFAPNAAIRAIIRVVGGESSTVDISRDELAKSTVAAMASLAGYRHQRPAIEGSAAGGGEDPCTRISVKSVAIEQGRLNGKPYRFESTEEYLLEQRSGVWLAIRAETAQR